MLWWTLRKFRTGSFGEQCDAAQELVRTHAVGPLIEILKEKNADLRERAAEALGKIGDARAMQSLTEALKDPSDRVRKAVAYSLGAIGDARALRPLAVALGDSDRHVGCAAAKAIKNLEGTEFSDAGALELLTLALKCGDWEIRETVARTLKKFGGSQAIGILLTALTGSDSDLRATAEEELDKINPDWMRSERAKALIPSFVAGLQDPLSSVRRTAAEKLEKLGWQPANDEERALRAAALRDWVQLASLGHSAVGPLLVELRGEDLDVSENAAKALNEADPDWATSEAAEAAVRTLIRSLGKKNSRSREILTGTLEKIDPHWRDSGAAKEIVSELLSWLKDEFDFMREAGAYALGEIGDKRAVEPLTDRLEDASERARTAAEQALPKIDPAWVQSITLDAILIMFNREFSPKEKFVNSILEKMKAKGRPYKEWMSDSTPVRVLVIPNTQDPMKFMPWAIVQFRPLVASFSVDNIRYATFEGSEGISGVVVTHWSS